MSTQYICSNCGHAGNGRTRVKGSIIFELFLWLLFTIPALSFPLISGVPLLLLVPLIYSIWRLTTKAKVCVMCEQPMLVPTGTPKGRELLKKYSSTVDDAID